MKILKQLGFKRPRKQSGNKTLFIREHGRVTVSVHIDQDNCEADIFVYEQGAVGDIKVYNRFYKTEEGLATDIVSAVQRFTTGRLDVIAQINQIVDDSRAMSLDLHWKTHHRST
jgi:hypothetical protein